MVNYFICDSLKKYREHKRQQEDPFERQNMVSSVIFFIMFIGVKNYIDYKRMSPYDDKIFMLYAYGEIKEKIFLRGGWL
jgi:hypothetical protein